MIPQEWKQDCVQRLTAPQICPIGRREKTGLERLPVSKKEMS